MTDATVAQQGVKEAQGASRSAQAAESSSSSSSSERSTDTEMGLVDVCTILCKKNLRQKVGVKVAQQLLT